MRENIKYEYLKYSGEERLVFSKKVELLTAVECSLKVALSVASTSLLPVFFFDFCFKGSCL